MRKRVRKTYSFPIVGACDTLMLGSLVKYQQYLYGFPIIQNSFYAFYYLKCQFL